MANRYWAGAVAGGGSGAMDLIDPTDTDGSSTVLAAGDTCRVVEDDLISEYVARNSGGASESLPDVVIPDANAGNFWWELVEYTPQNTGMINQLLYENMPGAF